MDLPERRTLYIDVDSTIWPAEVEYLKAEMKLHGTQNFLDKWFEHHELIEMYGEDYSDIFKVALDPSSVHERELYPYVAEYLCNLYHGMCGGFDLHFISHNMFASEIRQPMHDWLSSKMHTHVEFELTVVHQRFRKENIMKQDPGAWGLVDDVPKNLHRAREAGFHVFCKAQSWNEGIDVPRFEEWYELPELIEDLTEPDERAMMLETL